MTQDRMPRFNLDAVMHVFSRCDTATLMSCAHASDAFQSLAAEEFWLRVTLLLQPFVGGRLKHFFGLLRLHNAIISGSVALAFFQWPTAWVPGDLDIYVGKSDYDAFVVDLERLFQVELETDFGRRQPEPYTGIRHVRRYKSVSGGRLEIIQSRSPSALSPLFYFWSSVVVNFITPYAAVCGFPDHTLSGQGFVTHGTPTRKAASARKKYEARGVAFSEVPFWRRGGERLPNGARIFSVSPLLVLDFQTVWSQGSARLPIFPTTSGWLLKSPSTQLPDSANTAPFLTRRRSASVDQSQSTARRSGKIEYASTPPGAI